MARMDAKAIIVAVVVGIVAGWLASLVVGGDGIVYYAVIGLVGSVVGNFLLNALGIKLPIGEPIVGQVVVGAIGAIVLVLLVRLIA